MPTFINTLKAGQEAQGSRLKTGSDGRIVISAEEDRLSAKFSVQGVGSYWKTRGSSKWEHDTALGPQGFVADSRWELTITPSRVVVWLPLVSGVFGGMKMKPGKATGGTVPFAQVDKIDRDRDLWLTFQVVGGGPLTDGMALELRFASPEDARKFSACLADSIIGFWRERKVAGIDRIEAELSRLRDLDWSGSGKLSLSLAKAGAPIY